MDINWSVLLEGFRFAPAIVALLIVIFLMYKLLVKKEENITKIIELDDEAQKRNERIITILEILVNRRDK